MKSFSLKSRWIAPSRALFPSLSPQDKLKFHDKVEFPSGYSPPNFYNQLLIYSLEIFKQVFKFFFFFEKKILAPFFPFSLSRPREEQSRPANHPVVPPKLNYRCHSYPPDRCLSCNHRNFRSRVFFFDGSRRGATPGYSLNFIVYLLITGRWALGAMYRTNGTYETW